MFPISRLLLPLFHPSLGLELHRTLSSQAPVLQNAVKHRLRALYKLVHPDLFHDDPTAKGENERSFKLLQEYLAAAEERAGSGGAAIVPYRFVFYVKQPSIEGQDIEPNRVSLTLPPPNRALAEATHKALNRLFSECGIASHDDEGEGGAISHTVSLREFIPAAAERFHAAATQHGGPRYELSALRAALQMTRHISLVFGGAMTRASSLEQLEAGRQLLHVLEQDCLAEVVGVQIGIGDGYGSDASGALWLWSEGDAPSWAKFLQGTDLEWHRTQRAKAAALRSREQAAAKALGVGMVLGHPAAVSTPQYERLMNDIADAGPAGSGQAMLQKVVLRLEPGSGGGGASGCRTDGLGKICLPVDLPLPDILACVKQLGPTAAREADALAKEEADIATLRRQVERALKLRLLSRDPDLPTHKFRAACLRLLQHSAALMPLLDGLPLRVTEVNSFVPGRSAIDIAWNFTP